MDRSFDPDKFIRRIGERLIEEFKDAKSGTTPSTVGTAAEQPVRDQLEQILPRGIAVGEGFVIDSYSGTSRQQDVILYERDICPVFSVNNTPQTTYYPCEGVIAVGEVKSSLDTASLMDAFQKVASVKQLRRHIVHEFMPNSTTGEPVPSNRNYLSTHRDSIINFDADLGRQELFNIYGFILAGESRLKYHTLVTTFQNLSTEARDCLLPNLLVSLDGYTIGWGNFAKEERKENFQSKDGTYGVKVYKDGPERWRASLSAESATSVGGVMNSDSFRVLIGWLRRAAEQGRTSAVRSFDRYFQQKHSEKPQPVFYIPK